MRVVDPDIQSSIGDPYAVDTELDRPTFLRGAEPPTAEYRYATTAPNADGWWFNRPKGSTSEGIPLRVFLHNDRYYVMDPNGQHVRAVITMPDEWAGPIPYPLDAA